MNVWTDGCFDMVHYGHINHLRQAKSMGSRLIVGIHSDEEITKHKGPPIFHQEEREFMLRSMKWCDELIMNAPYITTINTLNLYNCDFCVHGDDITLSIDGYDTYEAVKEVGRYKECKRTLTISTTDLIDRMLTYKSTVTEQTSKFISLVEYKLGLIELFQTDSPPVIRNHNTSLCIFGIFDLFHPETVKFILTMRKTYDYIICVVLSDDVAQSITGRFPIMDIYERCLCLMGCKYIDKVIYDPLSISEFLNGHNTIIGIDIELKHVLKRYQINGYNHATILKSPNQDSLQPNSIISRVLDNFETYQQRNARKKINNHLHK